MPTQPLVAPKAVHVAVAVIHYQNQFLLGYRSRQQHQGDRFEFVGGKIEADEPAAKALIREVREETGIDLSQNPAIALGQICHDYGDKCVCLHVYQIALTAEQFSCHRDQTLGLENQPLIWVDKNDLIAKKFPLPAANQTILSWLSLPSCLVITLPISEFAAHPDSDQAWLDYHVKAIPKQAWVYIRVKAEDANEVNSASSLSLTLPEQLLKLRADIQAILPLKVVQFFMDHDKVTEQIVAAHLSQSELLAQDSANRGAGNETGSIYNIDNSDNINSHDKSLPPSVSVDGISLPLIVSCHDNASIDAANRLAKARYDQQLAPVIGMLLAPVLATKSHPDQAGLGWQSWSALAKLATVPVIALGGLAPESLTTAKSFGATGVAGIRQFLDKV